MGISRSLTIGASSIKAEHRKFDVISNNISNVNTTGFKSSNVNFIDQFYQTMRMGNSPDINAGVGLGGIDPLQYGLGVKVGSVTKDLSQGSLESTNNPLDMALQGNGYFIYNYNGQQVFSRAAAISRDKAGNLVDSSTGALLQGYNVQFDSAGRFIKSNGANNVKNALENINIPSTLISPPKQTENITATGNLDSQAATGDKKEASITIYDNAGAAHTLALTFTKAAGTPPATTWDVTGVIDGNSATQFTLSSINFDANGLPNSANQSINVGTAALNTALGTGATNFDTTINGGNIVVKLFDANNPTSGLTDYAGTNSITLSEQDGYAQGSLSDLSVDAKGKIWGAFTNGQSEIVGQVAVAKFANPQGLMDKGQNFLAVAPDSGRATIGTAGEIFPSTQIVGGALEQSNVDLTDQFTDMITTQRAFEAASRTITVSDQMLQEINMLKR